jgi:multidrug resistance efflux pump
MRIRFHREARTAPDVIDGLKVPYAPAKRNAPKWRWYLILAVVLSPALWLVGKTAVSMLSWSANGSVMLEPYEVRAPQSARIAELKVRAGAEVAEGDVIMKLHDPELDMAIAEATARKAATPAGVARPDTRLLLSELNLQQQALRRQQERMAATEELVREGAATTAELRETQIAVDQTMAAVLRVQQQLEPRSPRVAASANDESRALQLLLRRRDLLTVRAPAAGRVLDVFVSEGEFIGAGDSLLLIGRGAQPQVIAYVAPDIAPKLVVGSRATIRFPDGRKAHAFVAEQPMLTRQMPSNLVDQFGMRPMTVVLRLQTESEWPEGQRIHGLPVVIRFHYGWEKHRGEVDAAAQSARVIE